jgi:hypothetical protein
MAKVILNPLVADDSPIYDQGLVIGGRFPKPLFPNTENLSPMDYTLALIEAEIELIKRRKQKCPSAK